MKFLLLLWQCALATIINKEITRNIDITKPIVKIKQEITYNDPEKIVKKYVVTLPKEEAEHLSMIFAKCNNNNCQVKRDEKQPDDNYVFYTIEIESTVPQGEDGKIVLTTFYTHRLIPYPEYVTQDETQFVVYSDSHLVASPYSTTTQTTSVKCYSTKIESYSKEEPVSIKGSKIIYGKYDDIAPFSDKKYSLRIHGKNHAPFITLTNVVKELEVSMWGKVSVEEVYDLHHTGAKLKGGFSRLDYSNNGKVGASYSSLRAVLPKDADNIYYRDIIGKILTSQTSKEKTHTNFKIQPRFPIFGGWKTQWYMGYNVPTESVLTHQGQKFALKMEFSTPFDDAVVDDLTVKVILPEGATNINTDIPFEIDESSTTTRKTYLDSAWIGRPVLILNKKNLIPYHNVPFTVTFDFEQNYMLHEFGLLFGGYMAFFTLCTILSRVNLSIATGTPSKTSKTTKVE